MVDSGGHDDPAYALLFSERLDRSTCGLTAYDVSPTRRRSPIRSCPGAYSHSQLARLRKVTQANCNIIHCHTWSNVSLPQDSLAERSMAVAQGAIPQLRGLEPHSCHHFTPAQPNETSGASIRSTL